MVERDVPIIESGVPMGLHDEEEMARLSELEQRIAARKAGVAAGVFALIAGLVAWLSVDGAIASVSNANSLNFIALLASYVMYMARDAKLGKLSVDRLWLVGFGYAAFFAVLMVIIVGSA